MLGVPGPNFKHVRKVAEQEIRNRRQGISFLLYMSVSKVVGGWWTENNRGQVLLIEHAKILTGNSKTATISIRTYLLHYLRPSKHQFPDF